MFPFLIKIISPSLFKPLRPVVEQPSSFYLAYEKKSNTQKSFFRFLHFFKQMRESVSAKTTHDENVFRTYVLLKNSFK